METGDNNPTFVLLDGLSLATPASEFARTNIVQFTRDRIAVKLDDDASYPEANGAQIYRQLREEVIRKMGEEPMYSKLINNFNRADWEAYAAETVSAIVDREPLLREYRTDGYLYLNDTLYRDDELEKALRENPGKTEDDIIFVNGEKEQDLTVLTKDEEIDCDKFTAIKGRLLHDIDKEFLDPNDPDPAKRPQEYYLAAGSTIMGYHAYIISSATGNIIESVNDNYAYVTKDDPKYRFEDFVSGVPFRGHYTDINGKRASDNQYTITTGDYNEDIFFQRRAALMAGNVDALQNLTTGMSDFQSKVIEGFDKRIYLANACEVKDPTLSLTPQNVPAVECPESEFKAH